MAVDLVHRATPCIASFKDGDQATVGVRWSENIEGFEI